MNTRMPLLTALLLTPLAMLHSAGAPKSQLQPAVPATQYILFNRAPGQGMNQAFPESLGRKQFDEVLARFPNRAGARLQTGVSYMFSPFRTPPEKTVAALKTFLETASCRRNGRWMARRTFFAGRVSPVNTTAGRSASMRRGKRSRGFRWNTATCGTLRAG